MRTKAVSGRRIPAKTWRRRRAVLMPPIVAAHPGPPNHPVWVMRRVPARWMLGWYVRRERAREDGRDVGRARVAARPRWDGMAARRRGAAGCRRGGDAVVDEHDRHAGDHRGDRRGR